MLHSNHDLFIMYNGASFNISHNSSINSNVFPSHPRDSVSLDRAVFFCSKTSMKSKCSLFAYTDYVTNDGYDMRGKFFSNT